MSGITNRGKWLFARWIFRNAESTATVPTQFFVALLTSSAAVGAGNALGPDSNLLSDHDEISVGNGYATAGGTVITADSAGFDVATEDDASDFGNVQLKDVVWTAAGGSIPATSQGARMAVLLDTNATAANRQILAYWDLSTARSVSSGQTLTLQNCEIRFTEV